MRAIPPSQNAALSEVHYWGLTRSAWTQIGTLAVLIAAVFWHNLIRLWEKTNPINGEANWQHSFCVPLIGLYFLYLNREELFSAKIEPLLPGTYSRRGLLASCVLMGVSALGWLVWRFVPVESGALFSLASMARPAFLGMFALGALSLAGWGLGTLLFGLLVSAYGIWPGRNDFTSDIGGIFALFGLVLML
ncbi:MAG: hypothetical protein JO353_13080, partial [Phycisphaerae bacterium]|nr:hypothetical protein [Phycisphaerae bacterium]